MNSLYPEIMEHLKSGSSGQPNVFSWLSGGTAVLATLLPR